MALRVSQALSWTLRMLGLIDLHINLCRGYCYLHVTHEEGTLSEAK